MFVCECVCVVKLCFLIANIAMRGKIDMLLMMTSLTFENNENIILLARSFMSFYTTRN